MLLHTPYCIPTFSEFCSGRRDEKVLLGSALILRLFNHLIITHLHMLHHVYLSGKFIWQKAHLKFSHFSHLVLYIKAISASSTQFFSATSMSLFHLKSLLQRFHSIVLLDKQSCNFFFFFTRTKF